MVEVALALIGPGLVGSTLLAQLAQQARSLVDRYGISLNVTAISSSKLMLTSHEGVSLPTWKDAFSTAAVPSNMAQLTEHLSSSKFDHRVVIDCTASDTVPALYKSWAERGFHIITPNKKMGSGTGQQLEDFRSACRSQGAQFFYESTVGAGLPVISTLRSLLDTGDRVKRIEGVLSGTLSYIFSSYRPPQNSFSQVVSEAKAAGYTEPDPRDDLSGTDVARKVVILARECGLEAEVSALDVKSLVPEPLREASVEEFMRRLPEFDSGMEAEAGAAAAEGSVIRYVGVVDVEAGTCEVALRRYPQEHPFAQLRGSDNMISFTTQRYSSSNPLIVRGPGAGAEVTAAGVFSDLVTLCRMLR